MFGELAAFVRRNGASSVIRHIVEIYFGALLRWLPGPEGLVLRGLLYRLLFESAGRSLLIYPHVYIIFSDRIRVGDRLAVNVGCYLDGRGGISFGDNVMLGPNCSVVSVEHGHARTDIPMALQPYTYAPIKIGSDVWFGANVCVTAGVAIGDGSIVGANSVVTRDIPPYSIAVGSPARVTGSRLV